MVHPLLSQTAVCPSCRQELTSKSGLLYCARCRVKYPEVGNIPWLFGAPDAALLEWQQRSQFHLQTMVAEIKSVELSYREARSALTRKRLEKIAQGLHHNLTVMAELLKPLVNQGQGTKAVSDAVKSQLPLTQKLMGYYTNLHRDWCWGETENQATHDFVEQLGRGQKWGRVLVIGAGSGRYAYDLAVSGRCDEVVALDINPLLVFFGRQVASGKSINFNEFPIAPKSSSAVVVSGECKAPRSAPSSLIWLFADGMNPPFRAESFDTVVTPWFIDVIPQSLSAMSARINRLLKPQGAWINFGPYGFLQSPWSSQFSLEELTEVVQGQGFQLPTTHQTEVPYLQSPHSGQRRFENILGFKADKMTEVIEPAPYRHYPDWLLDLDLAVLGGEKFSRYLYANQLQAEVLQQIDDKKSIREMAKGFAQKYKLENHQAEAAILTLLRQLWDQEQ